MNFFHFTQQITFPSKTSHSVKLFITELMAYLKICKKLKNLLHFNKFIFHLFKFVFNFIFFFIIDIEGLINAHKSKMHLYFHITALQMDFSCY